MTKIFWRNGKPTLAFWLVAMVVGSLLAIFTIPLVELPTNEIHAHPLPPLH